MTAQVKLDDLIDTANKLCTSLDSMATNELSQCSELSHQFDIWSWEALRMVNNLKHIKEMI